MSSFSALSLYQRLPYGGKVAAASLRGYRLRRWRYGTETARLVDEALEREQWSGEHWQAWQRERLQALLRRAGIEVPFYRERFVAAPAELCDWPVLHKYEVRESPWRFVRDSLRPRTLFREHTSGSTGTPLDLWWSRPATRAWYALHEARTLRWHGLVGGDRWAILGGQLVAAPERERPPYWVWNAPMRQLYLSSYHLRPQSVAHYLEALERHRVVYLLGYPSAMASLARLALQLGLTAPRLRLAISNAEPLWVWQREAISELFGCPVRETYGQAEMVAAGSECEHGNLHWWPEVGWVEVLDDETDEPVGPGETGRLVATGLLNDAMPLVRYETGDRVRCAKAGASCPCGRKLPLVGTVEGRLDDVLSTPDGREVGRLDPVFKTELPVVEAQIVQEALDRVVVRVVPGNGFEHSHEEVILERLADRLGPQVRLSLERVEALPRDRSGKLRTVVSCLAPPVAKEPK